MRSIKGATVASRAHQKRAQGSLPLQQRGRCESISAGREGCENESFGHHYLLTIQSSSRKVWIQFFPEVS